MKRLEALRSSFRSIASSGLRRLRGALTKIGSASTQLLFSTHWSIPVDMAGVSFVLFGEKS